ncbi:hypothetical protein LEP1GSC168_0782 [Leptospira santarosai str. HAI134]|nr:hypothetical protein LEP1GSC168_0782 [Leptospira santarosai str. HAI134]
MIKPWRRFPQKITHRAGMNYEFPRCLIERTHVVIRAASNQSIRRIRSPDLPKRYKE